LQCDKSILKSKKEIKNPSFTSSESSEELISKLDLEWALFLWGTALTEAKVNRYKREFTWSFLIDFSF